jgi:hypothetical protein
VHKDEITTSGNWPKNIVYTSVVEYKDDVSQFSDAQLAGLVQQGKSSNEPKNRVSLSKETIL